MCFVKKFCNGFNASRITRENYITAYIAFYTMDMKLFFKLLHKIASKYK